MNVTINRQLLGVEDLAFGVGTVTQIRGGVSGTITLINASNLPFDDAKTLQEVYDEMQPLLDNAENLIIVASNINDVLTVASSIGNVNIVASNIAEVNNVATDIIPNLVEILQADSNAIIATTKASESSISALAALTSENNALASELKAFKWSEELEDVEVEPGLFSAKHWAFKARSIAADGIIGVLLRNTNLNTVILSGTYGVIGSGNTNTPIAGEAFLEVISDDTGRTMQKLTYPSGSQYTRVFSGIWSSWVSFNEATDTYLGGLITGVLI